jgi:hypothetical protein
VTGDLARFRLSRGRGHDSFRVVKVDKAVICMYNTVN